MTENTKYQQEYIFDEIAKNELEIKLQNFEGPLHLLLHLVKENKIEIKDIFVSEVTQQFLSYMDQLVDLDLDLASEYMATAATLLEIKSFSLLPKLPNFDDNDDPQKIFIKRLEEYKMFKEVLSELKNQENVNRFYREPDKMVGEEVVVPKEKLSIDGFVEAFNKLLMKMQVRTHAENTTHSIVKETFSVSEKVRWILDSMANKPVVNFSELFSEQSTRLEIVTVFSAVLELLRLQLVSVKQEQRFGEIVLTKRLDTNLSEEEIYGTIEK